MKRHISFILFLSLVLSAFSQSDSLAFVHGPWRSERVDGLVLRRCQFEQESLFASNQHILVWELADNGDFALQFAYRPERTKTSDMAKEQHAVAAVNGSFFDMDRHFPVLFLRIDGEDFGHTIQEEAKLQSENYRFGTLAMAHDSVFILKNDTVFQWEEGLPYPNMMTARPLLIFEGETLPLQEDLNFVSGRHNRTAVGIRDDGTVLLIVVDGRAPKAAGMSLQELQQVMRWLGCRNALNLDGGGSATFYADFGGNHGVLNYPTDNSRFDHEGERTVSNAVLVVRKTKKQ
jgi:exopolysaccharide biosynthesis protein